MPERALPVLFATQLRVVGEPEEDGPADDGLRLDLPVCLGDDAPVDAARGVSERGAVVFGGLRDGLDLLRGEPAGEQRVYADDASRDQVVGLPVLAQARVVEGRRGIDHLPVYGIICRQGERIADHAMGVAYVARELQEKRMDYHPAAWKELGVLEGAVTENVRLTVHAFAMDKLDIARRVEPLSHVIDTLCDTLKQHHIDRLQSGDCTMEQGISFNDLLTNCRDISDHCTKIARAMLELDAENAMNTHAYRKEAAREAQPIYEEYQKKYAV